MPLLTPEQIAKLQQIIRDGSTALAIAATGHEVPKEELERLVAEGYIDPFEGTDLVKDAFAFGQLMQQLPAAAGMSYQQFAAHLEKHPVTLSEVERHSYDVAKTRAGLFCVGLGNRFAGELGTVLTAMDAEYARKVRGAIADETARRAVVRSTVGELKSRLGHLSNDWARDWDRIAATESHLAHQEGFLEATISRYGDEALLAKMVEPGACADCKRLYLGPDGNPIVKPASWWLSRGVANVGRKRTDWKPVLGAMHPWCRCQLVRVPAGWHFEDGDLVPAEAEKSLQKGGGPYIGPRGGKWADPKHTIPWKGIGDSSRASHDVTMHRKIFGAERKETYHRVSETDTHVKLSRHGPDGHGPTMPRESVKHFVNDLAGRVELPPHKSNADVNAVIRGKAELLGKGDDGIAFKVGDKVVKVSTTVPFQPENPGHRTPEQAADMLKQQVAMGNQLADLGVEGIQRSEYVRHGDKGFQIKPWVELPEKFTREQLDQIQDIVLAIHGKGFAINDAIQAGIDANGKIVMFDIGKLAPIKQTTGIYADTHGDLDNLKRLYRDNGEDFVKRGVSEGQAYLDRVLARFDKWLAGSPPGFAERHLEHAVSMLKDEANATLTGDKLKARLKEIDEDVWVQREEIAYAKEKANVEEKEAGLAKSRKLHYRTTFQGFPVSIENRKGSIRRWYDPHTDTEGQTKMVYPYGYIRGTEGTDGDHVDVFLGPDEQATKVYVVHQLKAPAFKVLDEDKAMMGFPNAVAARKAYLQHYDTPRFYGGMTVLSIEDFRRKVGERKGEMIKSEQLSLFGRPGSEAKVGEQRQRKDGTYQKVGPRKWRRVPESATSKAHSIMRGDLGKVAAVTTVYVNASGGSEKKVFRDPASLLAQRNVGIQIVAHEVPKTARGFAPYARASKAGLKLMIDSGEFGRFAKLVEVWNAEKKIAKAGERAGKLRSKGAPAEKVEAAKDAIGRAKAAHVKATAAYEKVDKAFSFDEIFDQYDRMAGELETGTLTVVAPDRIGDGEATAQLREKYAPRVRELQNKGVRVIVPIQARNAREIGEDYIRAVRLFGDDILLGFPTAAETLPIADILPALTDIYASGRRNKIHFLGGGAPHLMADRMVQVVACAYFSARGVDKARVLALCGDPKTAAHALRQVVTADDLDSREADVATVEAFHAWIRDQGGDPGDPDFDETEGWLDFYQDHPERYDLDIGSETDKEELFRGLAGDLVQFDSRVVGSVQQVGRVHDLSGTQVPLDAEEHPEITSLPKKDRHLPTLARFLEAREYQGELRTPDVRSGFLSLFDKALKEARLRGWASAIEAAGIPLAKFPLVVKHAQEGAEAAQELMRRVESELHKASAAVVTGGTKAPIGTMGHQGKPARTAGENVRPDKVGEPRDDWPPARHGDEPKRRKIRRTKEDLESVKGRRTGDGPPVEKPRFDEVREIEGSGPRKPQKREARESFDRQVEARREYRGAGRLAEGHQDA